jgi:hypothetical protein
MEKKRELTIQEHHEAGILMKLAYINIAMLQNMFGEAYPATDLNLLLKTALDSLLKANAIAERHLFDEHPADADTDFYRGGGMNGMES